MVSLAEEDHLRRLFGSIMPQLPTIDGGTVDSWGASIRPLSILFSVILSALPPVHHNNTFLEN